MPYEEQTQRGEKHKIFMLLLRQYFFPKDTKHVINLNTMLNWALKSINRTKDL